MNYIQGKSVFSGQNLNIGIHEGMIVSVDRIEDHCQDYLCPGFLDIQINGYHGKNYSNSLSPLKIEEMVRDLLRSGTTRHLPTIITNSTENILSAIRSVVAARKSSPNMDFALPGIHMEGPFISSDEGARGVHDPSYIRAADYDEFGLWQEEAEGLIKIVTLSPEDDNSLDFIEKISRDGVIAAIGHTNAPVEMIERAVDAGARLSTHLGNGCPSFIPRLQNLLWKQLSDSRLSTSIIADGFHLPPYVLKCIVQIKGNDKLILISDAAELAGSSPGIYKWGNMDIRVFEDGYMGLNNTSNLAGSSFLLNKCISHLKDSCSLTLNESVRYATVNPAKLLSLEVWEPEPLIGDVADLCTFSLENGSFHIQRAISFNTEFYSEVQDDDLHQ